MMHLSYNPWLVALSIAVALLVAYTALALAERIFDQTRVVHSPWLIASAAVMGVGIWSMHFIAMLAHSLPIRLTYDLGMTVASLGVAVATSAAALRVVVRPRSPAKSIAAASLLLGGGIGGMHYLGMAAIGIVPGILWDYRLVALSIAIAVLASWASLWLKFAPAGSRISRWPFRRFLAAMLLCMAISGLHFTGMAAAQFSKSSICHGGISLDNQWLALVIGVFAMGILGLALLTAVFDAHLESRNRAHAKELERANATLLHLATHDTMTGLPNRKLFLERLEQAILRAQRADCRFAVFGIDLNDFKLVNDTHGHAVGDELLCQVGSRLVASIRESDTVARFGGDEFVVLACELAGPADAGELARKLAMALEKPFLIGNTMLALSASIGVANYPADGGDAGSLLLSCDAAMYRAKKSKHRLSAGPGTMVDDSAPRLAAGKV